MSGSEIATTSGVTTAPTAAPELKIPLPRPRSAGGNTRAVTRNAHGQLNDSPTPSNARQTINHPKLGSERGRYRRQRPPRHGCGIRPAQIPAIDKKARRYLKDRVGHHKGRENPAEIFITT